MASGDPNVDRVYRETWANELEARMRAHPNACGLTREQARFSVDAVRREVFGGNLTRAAELADELMERKGP